MLVDISDIKELEKIASELAKKITKAVIYLQGDLGTGKTSFVRLWLSSLGWKKAITSPTYSLMNVYQIKNTNIMHSDLYRINNPEELIYLDVDQWTYEYDLIFIEWPEKAENLLPKADFIALFELEETSRKLEWINNKIS